jgi:TfoX/Sxy family transcriptional regulator of competence genes
MPLSRGKSDLHDLVLAAVTAMPGVSTKRMFGADAFFTHSRMFAFLFDEAIVLKLPDAERQDALASRVARPFLTGASAAFGRWVEIELTGSEAGLRACRLAAAAHALAQAPDHDGPRVRRPAVKRRQSTRRSPRS